MTYERLQAFFAGLSLSWITVFFGGLFVLAAINKGEYIVEGFATFIFGVSCVYLDRLELSAGEAFFWSRFVLFALWILVIASRSLTLLQPLNLWFR